MASIQSRTLASWLRRQKFFSGEQIDPLKLRLRIERLASKAPPPRRVRVVPVAADSVPGEWLIPPDAPQDRALLYIHGGAWFMGSTTTHRPLVSSLAYASRVRALSINYRLAPEHPFPRDWMIAWPRTNGCCAAASHRIRSSWQAIRPAGISPWPCSSRSGMPASRCPQAPSPSLRQPTSPSPGSPIPPAPISTRSSPHLGPNTIVLKDYVTDHDPRDPLISPLYADLHGLPPLLLHVGDHEALLDGVVGFGERAAAAGVDVQMVVWPGMFHVFQIFAPILPEARQANAQIAAFIRSRLDDRRQTPDS